MAPEEDDTNGQGYPAADLTEVEDAQIVDHEQTGELVTHDGDRLPIPIPSGLNPDEAAIYTWLVQQAASDAAKMIGKRREYGSEDLVIMGAAMGGPAGEEHAIAFYALGKIARVVSALKTGRVPHPDSWDDLVAYGNMARFGRTIGPW